MANPNGVAETRSTDGETRRAVLQNLLQQGPLSATQLGKILGLSATGIRRHLDNLVDEGIVEPEPARKSGTAGHSRGRPAKSFRLTNKGRALFGNDYTGLAADALETLRETGGDKAVKAFARKRAEKIVAGIETPEEDPASLAQAAHAVVEAFTKNGYAATVNDGGNNMQICQHHCPIAEVAAEFPELCEAEHEAIASLLGHHVQPLASIVDGNDVCTTNVPIKPISLFVHDNNQERSSS